MLRGIKLALLWIAVCLTLAFFDALLFMMAVGAHDKNWLADAVTILATALTVISYFALIPGLLFLSYRDIRARNRQSQLPSS